MPFSPKWEDAMPLQRRKFLHLAAAAATTVALPNVARTQDYPSRPVRVMVGFPPGGGVDVVARIIAQSLSSKFGQQFVVENRPGAGSNIATEAVAKASPDGYTLLLISVSAAINAALDRDLNFNLTQDIAPVAGIMRVPGVMEVSPSFPAKTVPEFIAYAKANPGKINMASAGNGTLQHLCGEMFKQMTGIEMIHVPYRGSPAALTALMAGEAQVTFDPLPSSIALIQSGKLRALAYKRDVCRYASGDRHGRGVCRWLRGERLVWSRGADKDVRGNYSKPQSCDKCGPAGCSN